jgi:hypothetical protein
LLPKLPDDLKANVTNGAQVRKVGKREDIWRLEIPPGPSNRYRLAQLDDYTSLPRRAFPWSPPLRFSLHARSSSASTSGTWGFGLWNDPFSMGVLSRAGGIRLPTLPNAAWFFFASPSNYLSFRDDLPAQGWLASTFRSSGRPFVFSMLCALTLPLLLLPPYVRLIRRLLTHFICHDAVTLVTDPTAWSSYELIWKAGRVEFRVNDELIFQTSVAPAGPLGLVIWIDNQYAAVLPAGRLHYGFLATTDLAWIEISQLSVVQI